ncbi:MAG TPA: ABC transporter ATP-binding protein [Alphaproteobacteria bacterium]|nr:ABC transporter ATP-binding protein [Alphaproteobacteria bacterium]
MTAPVIEVRGLRTSFPVEGGRLDAVRGVDFDLRQGEVLGLIGESGSGKTMTGLSVLRLLPEAAETEAQSLRFKGEDLLQLSDEAFRALRGTHLAMVFQNPAGAFNPAKTIAWHMREIFRRKAARAGRSEEGDAPRDWRAETRRRLAEIGIAQPSRILKLYPHQLSGGMLQRVLIAMVLALEPDVIIADEPTTNLDNIVERQILVLFRRLQKRLSVAIMFITHDMTVAAALCDRIAVMYAGEIVEIGATSDIFHDPKHPYTQGLLATATALTRGGRLREIPGELPGALDAPPGCLFEPRCPHARAECRAARPAMRSLAGERQVRCVLYG